MGRNRDRPVRDNQAGIVVGIGEGCVRLLLPAGQRITAFLSIRHFRIRHRPGHRHPFDGSHLSVIEQRRLIRGRVEDIPLRRDGFDHDIVSEIQQLGGCHAVFRDKGIHQLPLGVPNGAVRGDDVLCCIDFKGRWGKDDRLAGFAVHLGNDDLTHLRGVLDGQAFGDKFHVLPTIDKGHIMGRIVQQIPLRRCHLGNGVSTKVQQVGRHHAVLGGKGVYQFARLMPNGAISGHDVLFRSQLKHGISSHNGLARFLVCFGDRNRPHLRSVVQR